MSAAGPDARTYQALAEGHERQGQGQMRDRFLVLAADAAFASGERDEAERLRLQLLQYNPHHLLKPYQSFAEALKSPDVQNYINALRRSHPPERALGLLAAQKAQAESAVDRKLMVTPVSAEELKVYSLRSREPDSKPPTPAPQAASQRAPASATRARVPGTGSGKRPVAGRLPTPMPEILAVRAENKMATPKPAPVTGTGAGEHNPRGFFSLVLAGLVFFGGLLMAAYTILHPFLPFTAAR
jgi:hypothetical protein